MLRIAKTTPGILDLSQVKDDRGLPVTLSGPSHRDVPDHEQDNPVLQRVINARWVTVSKVPVEEPSEPPPPPADDQVPAGIGSSADAPPPSADDQVPASIGSSADAPLPPADNQVTPDIGTAAPTDASPPGAATKPDRRSARRA